MLASIPVMSFLLNGFTLVGYLVHWLQTLFLTFLKVLEVGAYIMEPGILQYVHVQHYK